MTFFASVCIPLFTLIVFSAYRLTRAAAGDFNMELRALLQGSFLPGLALGIPVLILLVLLERLVPLSYKSFRLYLFFFLRDQVAPFLLLLLLAAWLRKAAGFLSLFFFLAGACTLLNWGQLSIGAGRPDFYRLCISAFVRMAMLIYIPLLYLRFMEEDGLLKLLFVGLMLLVTAAGGLVAYLYMRFYPWLALSVGIAMPASTAFLLLSKSRGRRWQRR
jgi:hypothetical protein